MKKFTSIFLAFAMFAVLVPLTVSAQKKYKRNYNGRNSRSNVTRQYQGRRKNFYGRNRNLINIGIGTAGGAILGGIFGGKKGALIGAGVGAGSGAAYTYGINPKKKRQYRSSRRNYRNR